MTPAFTIGVDFGTNSVRAVVIDCRDGRAIGTHIHPYRAGEQGVLLDARDPHLARQDPADYLEGLRESVKGALAAAEAAVADTAHGGAAGGRAHGTAADGGTSAGTGFSRARVIGIGVDTTGSTPLPVDASNQPLAFDPKWKSNLAAYAWLWKDHTAAGEAAEITAIAAEHAPELLAPIGGTYSSEWFWSKIWRCLRIAPEVFDAAASWVELADFVPSVLAGVTNPRDVVRGICAAGHKALYADAWGGLPPKAFLARLDPKLADLRDRLYERAYAADTPAGKLSAAWASTFGLTEGIAIAIGEFDAHYGAIGSGVTTGTFVKIIGTSTCDCVVSPMEKRLPDIPGICGIVPGSILPGYYGLEAGQSAVGDLLKWWVDASCDGQDALHLALTEEASQLRPGESGLLALDWNNGNRTVLVDPRLTGLLVGQTLHTSRAEIYRALIEATAFGARAIVERLEHYGVAIDRVVCCGGIAEKNRLFMQIYADVLGRPMLVAGSPQAPALGAAIGAAVVAGAAAGGYASFEEAQGKMTSLKPGAFEPNPAAVKVYDEIYGMYRELHDTFGGVAAAAAGDDAAAGVAAAVHRGTLMKRLLALRERVVSHASRAARATA
jgi:L-ribulokinase